MTKPVVIKQGTSWPVALVWFALHIFPGAVVAYGIFTARH